MASKLPEYRRLCLFAGRHILATLGKKFRCKICDAELLDKEHLERHYRVHNNPKPAPYGDPYFPQPMWSANVEGALTPLARVLFGKTEEDKKRKKQKTNTE